MKQQSQILFWLLLAATIAVDSVAIAWIREAGPLSLAAYLFEALVIGQLAVVCVWAVFRSPGKIWSLLAVTFAVLVCAVLDVVCDGSATARELVGIYAVFAASLVGTLWILRRSAPWRRITGDSSIVWQFSIGQVLVVTTLVALVITALRGSELLQEYELWRLLVALTICDVLLVVATMLAWAVPSNVFFRLAGACLAAAAIGVLLAVAATAGILGQNTQTTLTQDRIPIVAYAIVISLTLFAWLEFGSIVRHKQPATSVPPIEKPQL